MVSLFESATGLVLLDPRMLLFALAIPAALAVRAWRGGPAVRFAPAPLLAARLPGSWRTRLRPLPGAFHGIAILLAVVALARPVERVPLPRETLGIDVIVCLDVSSSMEARDLDPRRTRLDVAKEAAERFVAGRPNDRIGLVSFARFPDVRCPLTLDHAALAKILRGVEPVAANGPEDMTGIGAAVARSAQLLRSSAAPSKVVVLLTDGEENVATAQAPDEIAPVHAAQLCESLGVRAYTIVAGVGKPGPQGGVVPLDTSQVRRLADRTGGAFFEARDARSVAGVYDRIDRLEKAPLREARFRIEEKFLPFLAGALVLLTVARLLGATTLDVLP